MRAWRFSEFGDINNMTLGDHDTPEPGEGELRIKLNFASLNPADRLLVEGKYPGAGELPLCVGRDGSGLVDACGAGSDYKVGDAVIILRSEIGITRNGTLAEYVTVPERSVAALPEGWSFEEGAAAPLVYLTAWKALVFHGGLQAGQHVLVTGASGGVGVAAVQLAHALGAKVVALSRSEEKGATLKELGADAAIDSNAPDLEDQVRSALGGSGVDLVVENLAGPFIQTGINLVNLNGKICVIGLLAGMEAKILLGQVLFKQVKIEGVHVGKFSPDEAREAWGCVVETMDKNNLRPRIDRVFPMSDVQEAFGHLAGGHLGKVLVDVSA